jgi:hypothetical protein
VVMLSSVAGLALAEARGAAVEEPMPQPAAR